MITNLYSIPIWITVILLASMATVIYWGNNKYSSRAFALSLFTVALLTASIGYFLFVTDYVISDFGVRFTIFCSVLVASSLLYFIISFTKDSVPNKKITALLLLVLAVFLYVIFYTNLIIIGPIKAAPNTFGMIWGWQYGQAWYIQYGLLTLYFVIGALVLRSAYKATSDKAMKKNIIMIFSGLFIWAVVPFLFNTILPQFGYYNFTWLAPTTGIIWASLIAYSITRHHQMNIRVVVVEVLVIAMMIVAFINIFFNEILGFGGRIFIFGAIVVLGATIIRDALRETAQREELKDLNQHLQEKVNEQTKEIRASYQIERNAHLELEKVDEAKNQFILITQHHLRTPITSIRWQLEAIMGGTYGDVSAELKKAMGDMSESVGRLNHLIDNLLSISALRSGIETLNRAPVSLKIIVDDILTELQKDIDRKHLTLHLPMSKEVWPALSVDKDRMREALFVIIENAVRYNLENGSLSIAGRATENSFELTVENTGSELSSEDKKKIFSELFYRSSQAQTSHPTGMGIGLSMAQAIIEAHKGTISLGSRKEGGGVKVVVTLPY